MDVEVPTKTTVAQTIDDDGGAAPGGPGLIDDRPRTDRLATGLDPVVDQQDTVTGLEMILARAQAQIAVAVVRWRMRDVPAVAVGEGNGLFPQFHEPDAQVRRNQGTEQSSARLRAEHDRWRCL